MNPLPRLHVEMFRYYCPELPVKRVRRDLPHWEQEGVCAFVTFRLGDALPESVLQGWIAERDAWLVAHGIYPSVNEDWKDALEELGEELVKAFHRRFTARLHELLDAGYGECLLRGGEVRRIVEEALMHWHGERYLLAGWVIMPNHVHVLMQPMEGFELLKLCESWKRWTARYMNEAVGRRGHIWQGEGWDHLLRSAQYLVKYRRYLRRNPVGAKLRADEHTLWLPDIEGLAEDE